MESCRCGQWQPTDGGDDGDITFDPDIIWDGCPSHGYLIDWEPDEDEAE